jgi:hypothetical protein
LFKAYKIQSGVTVWRSDAFLIDKIKYKVVACFFITQRIISEQLFSNPENGLGPFVLWTAERLERGGSC